MSQSPPSPALSASASAASASAAASSSRAARVLSIQSSVVHGYVGNKAATLPLNLHGLDVDPIHTCQLSNHTGYPLFQGHRLLPEQMNELLQAMQANGFMQQYGYVLSGYMSTAPLLDTLAHTIRTLKQPIKQRQPSEAKHDEEGGDDDGSRGVFFVCDPVMGDNGKLYVPATFIPLYHSLLPFVDLLTPNQTELELLVAHSTAAQQQPADQSSDATSGPAHHPVPITTLEQAVRACRLLHDQGVRLIVVTSLTLPSDPLTIHLLATRRDSPTLVHHLTVPRQPEYFSGTGDLTAALLLAHWHHQPDACCLPFIIDRCITSVQAVIATTRRRQAQELALIQSITDLQHPERCTTQYTSRLLDLAAFPSLTTLASPPPHPPQPVEHTTL